MRSESWMDTTDFRTVCIMLRATRSLELPPAPFKNYTAGQKAGYIHLEVIHTSALARISHPVASDKDLIRISGVLPMHPSTPSTIGGGPGLTVNCGYSSSLTCPLSVLPLPLRRWKRRSSSGYRSLKPSVMRIPARKAAPM